jgi:hypothetical protein
MYIYVTRSIRSETLRRDVSAVVTVLSLAGTLATGLRRWFVDYELWGFTDIYSR